MVKDDKYMNEQPRQYGSPKAIFEESDSLKEAVNPELATKIKAAFSALEDVLLEAFPGNRRLAQVLSFLEIAAMYALQLLKNK